MIRITILLGASLIVLGGAAYGIALTGEKASITAMIPAFFGLPILGLGLAAAGVPARRPLFMHIAVALAVLGCLGSVRGLLSIVTLMTRPEDVARPAAVIVQSIMAVLCLGYVVISVRSFISARAKSS